MITITLSDVPELILEPMTPNAAGSGGAACATAPGDMLALLGGRLIRLGRRLEQRHQKRAEALPRPHSAFREFTECLRRGNLADIRDATLYVEVEQPIPQVVHQVDVGGVLIADPPGMLGAIQPRAANFILPAWRMIRFTFASAPAAMVSPTATRRVNSLYLASFFSSSAMFAYSLLAPTRLATPPMITTVSGNAMALSQTVSASHHRQPLMSSFPNVASTRKLAHTALQRASGR